MRDLINERLALFTNPLFKPTPPKGETDHWLLIIEEMTDLFDKKKAFFVKYGYEWTLHQSAYNSPFEMLLQLKLLRTLSDMSPDHPALDKCHDLVVRILPTSCARPHLRQVDRFRVIVLTTGYLSAFKGFIRLWLRGCALGGAQGEAVHPFKLSELSSFYIAGVQSQEAAMAQSSKAYVGTLVQLLENEFPAMDETSIFDEVLKREKWQTHFGILSTAIDGFLLFHETAHVLAGDSLATDRSLKAELDADRGSVSLSIIDEANGGLGTAYIGAPMFFCVELLRLLCEEIMEHASGRHDPAAGRYHGIEELMARSTAYGDHVMGYLGPMFHTFYYQWSESMGLVFDTVRWALLNTYGASETLSQFLAARPARRSVR